MLYEYLTKNYSIGDIIQADTISLGIPASTLRWQLKKLVDAGILLRVDNGMYCIPKKSRLGVDIYPSAEEVASVKYIKRNNSVMGYYSGAYFANQIGISTQVPNDLEIVTNKAGNPLRKVIVCGKTFTVRKSNININADNYAVLRLLDLLKNFDSYNELDRNEAMAKTTQYIRKYQIKKDDVDMYLPNYPDKTYRTIYELELYNVFA